MTRKRDLVYLPGHGIPNSLSNDTHPLLQFSTLLNSIIASIRLLHTNLTGDMVYRYLDCILALSKQTDVTITRQSVLYTSSKSERNDGNPIFTLHDSS